MALSALTAFNDYLITGNNEIVYGSYKRYWRSNGVIEYIPINYVELTLIPTGANNTRTDLILTYANKDQVKITYKLYLQNSNHYYMEWELWLADKNGNKIKTGGNWSSSFEFIEGNGRIPFANCFYMVTEIEWGTRPTTIAGDQAAVFHPIGGILYERFNRTTPLTGWKPMRPGEWEWEEFSDNFLLLAGSPTVDSDNDMNGYITVIDNGGDGTPYRDIGTEPTGPDPSGTGGGDTPSTDGGDAVDFPVLPSVNAISTGLISVYNPSNQNLRDLAGVLWGNDFEQSIKKILNDPFDGIIGLSMIPFSPTTSGSINCHIGNFDTEISMPVVSAQYYTIDFGSLNIPESWKNALDYSPTTECEIYLPFVGFRSLKVEDVVGNTVSLKYNIDVLTGSGIAMIKCGDKVLYNYPCKVSYDIPLTGSNKAALYTGLINIAMSGLAGAARGGAMGAIGGAATSAIQTATSKQSSIEKSGAITSNTGVLADFTPYIVLRRPIQSMPKNFKNIKGYQSNITATLGTLKGYTEVDYVHLTGFDMATDAELQEIEKLLKTGVII